ncbi:MAG: hypothetical protein N2504_03605 [candidate division WOR-3 bacterium]|nr:hypothetical protein [candidate division WOR-3 bacterium]MCX7947653.1 hypothetical protein [candidate division WOR-3 bacterium]MDW8150531.1 hypothetical protein [candidate division WOR-3 bacterium]
MEERLLIVELAKALKNKKNQVFIFIGPDGTSIKCAVEDGNILYIEGLYGSGKSELERLMKWKKGKIIERPLKDEDRKKKGEYIDPKPIISILSKIEQKVDILKEFQREFIKLLLYFSNEIDVFQENLENMKKINKGKNLYYMKDIGFLFLNNNLVEGFVNNLGNFLKDFYSNQDIIFYRLSVNEEEYDILKLPIYKEPEIEGRVNLDFLSRLLKKLDGLFYISEKDTLRIIILKRKFTKIYRTSPEVSILEKLEIIKDPLVLVYT